MMSPMPHPPWWMKTQTRRAPSRNCRDARVYGHTTTAMHDDDYTPLPPATGHPRPLGEIFICNRGVCCQRSSDHRAMHPAACSLTLPPMAVPPNHCLSPVSNNPSLLPPACTHPLYSPDSQSLVCTRS
ncbi:unnamed protein product, partial [Laminaria digitata]